MRRLGGGGGGHYKSELFGGARWCGCMVVIMIVMK